MGKHSDRGFTLLELMVVVAIVGLLSAVAIPSFMKYIASAKSAEADESIQRIALGARTYYMDATIGRGPAGALEPSQFPETTGLTPILSCCAAVDARCVPAQTAWEQPTWRGLQFAMTDPHYYRYEFFSTGTRESSVFTARAFGDLDCDGNFSTFETYGYVQIAGNDISIQGGSYKENRLE